MIEAGLIPEDRRVYLDDGRLYEKMAKSKPHGFVGLAINMAPGNPASSRPGASGPKCTVVLDDLNAPLPDFSVIRGAILLDFSELDRYPDTRDIGLLIEIGVTSVRQDLTTRIEKYARALIPAETYTGSWTCPPAGSWPDPERPVVDGRGVYSRVFSWMCPASPFPCILYGREVAFISFQRPAEVKSHSTDVGARECTRYSPNQKKKEFPHKGEIGVGSSESCRLRSLIIPKKDPYPGPLRPPHPRTG